jgi:transposase
MKNFTAEAKHAILLEYQPRSSDHSFPALARRHGVLGGGRIIRRWFERWNGTMQSLRPRPKSGRPPKLTPREIDQHIRQPVLAANKAHQAVHYTTVARQVRAKTHKSVSTRTVQRIGKVGVKGAHKHTKKAEARECEYKRQLANRCRTDADVFCV